MDPYTITREQLRALRRAHSISFHGTSFNTNGKTYDEHVIKASLDRSDNTRVEIKVNGGFGSTWHEGKRAEKITGFDMLHASQFHPTWRTIAGLIREGDELHLHWQPDYHSNGYARMVDLHIDTLELVIARKAPKTGRVSRMHFDVSTTVAPQNSARMIQGVTQRPDPYSPCVISESWDTLMHRSDMARREHERTVKETA